jgi:rhodanese-related sulfurtransferase
MTEQMRISAGEAHERAASGKALLVCAYRDEEACGKVQLEGSISLAQLESRLPGLPKDQEIIFYCA